MSMIPLRTMEKDGQLDFSGGMGRVCQLDMDDFFENKNIWDIWLFKF